MEEINKELFLLELKKLMKFYKVSSITLDKDDPTIYFLKKSNEIILEGDIYHEEINR